MNLKHLLFSALIFTGIGAQAQKPDTLRARINYSYTHVEDTTDRSKPYTENMVLLLGRNASLYTSIDRITDWEKQSAMIKEQMNNAAAGGPITISAPAKRLKSVDHFQFANEKLLVLKQRLVNDYLIEEPLPAIDWKISKDTMSISGLNCQKATARFKGRNYTAWFCPDLPFSAGPWKLNGLPGLIVEAYDTNHEVEFKFAGFEVVKPGTLVRNEAPNTIASPGGVVVVNGGNPPDVLTNPTIEFPKKAIKVSQKDYDKLVDAMRKDPAGFLNSALAGSGANIKIGAGAGPGSTTTTLKSPTASTIKPINNPLELEP